MCGRLLAPELLLLLGCATLAAIGCKADANEHYRTRGQVVSLEGAGEDARVAIHHEAIENFKDRDGKPSRMHSMIMNFSLERGLDRTPLQKDAKLEFEFDVRWSSGSPLVITNARALPEAASLVLE